MPRSTTLFSTGKAITGLGAISMGATLPPNSFVTGTLSIVEPFSPDHNPERGLVFTLKTILDNDLPSGSTYTIDGPAATKRVHLKFRLSPSAYTEALRRIMQTDSERLASREHPILLGHKVSIECSGTSVVTMNDDEKAVRRTLEGHGPRWAVREGDGHAPFQLLADANISSTSWFSARAASPTLPTPPTPVPALAIARPNVNAGGWPAVRDFEQVHAAAEAKARESALSRPLRPLSDFAPPPRALVSCAPVPSPARAPHPPVIPSACLGRASPSASPVKRPNPTVKAASPRQPIRVGSRSPSPLKRIDLTAQRTQALPSRSTLPPALPGGDSSNIDHPSVQHVLSQDKKSSSPRAMATQESPPTPESNPRSSPRPHFWSSGTNSYDETDRAARRDFALVMDTPDEGGLFGDLPPCGQPMPSMPPLDLSGTSPTQPMFGTRPLTEPTSFFEEAPMTFAARPADFGDDLSRDTRPPRPAFASSGDRSAQLREQRLREAQEALQSLDGSLTGHLKRTKSLEELSGSTSASREQAKRPKKSLDPQLHSASSGSDRNTTDAVVDVAWQRRREAEDRAREASRQRALQTAEADRRAALAAKDLRRGFSTPSYEYFPLCDVRPNHTLRGRTNVIAVVVDARPPSKKKDWIMSPALTDPSLQERNSDLPRGSEEHFVVTLFRRQEHELPALAPGTVILLRGLVISEYNGKPKGQAFSNSFNTWAWLDHECKLHHANAADVGGAPLQPAELQRMKDLHTWWRNGDGGATGGGLHPAARVAPAGAAPVNTARVLSSSAIGGGRKVCCLSELHSGLFYDAIFKILVVNDKANRMAMELYVTDGTTSTHRLRNFHDVTGDMPPQAVYVVAIQNAPPRQDLPAFQAGNILRLNNVRVKEYSGELETIWAEMITEDQDRMGYKAKRPIVLSRDAPEARQIEQRIRALKRGDEVRPNRRDSEITALDDAPLESIARAEPAQQSKGPARIVQLEEAFHTVYRDEVSHPLSTVEAMLANQTRPNRFRVQARVRSVVPQSGDALARKWCAKCRRSLNKTFCQSCNDHSFAHAQWRYRFIVLLEAVPEEGEGSSSQVPVFAAIIDHGEAAKFLPSLPPVSGQLDRPNDAKKNLQQVKEACRAAERVLMGPKYNGEWVRNAIEWTVERFDVPDRRGGSGAGRQASKDRVIDVFRVFGMTSSTQA